MEPADMDFLGQASQARAMTDGRSDVVRDMLEDQSASYAKPPMGYPYNQVFDTQPMSMTSAVPDFSSFPPPAPPMHGTGAMTAAMDQDVLMTPDHHRSPMRPGPSHKSTFPHGGLISSPITHGHESDPPRDDVIKTEPNRNSPSFSCHGNTMGANNVATTAASYYDNQNVMGHQSSDRLDEDFRSFLTSNIQPARVDANGTIDQRGNGQLIDREMNPAADVKQERNGELNNHGDVAETDTDGNHDNNAVAGGNESDGEDDDDDHSDSDDSNDSHDDDDDLSSTAGDNQDVQDQSTSAADGEQAENLDETLNSDEEGSENDDDVGSDEDDSDDHDSAEEGEAIVPRKKKKKSNKTETDMFKKMVASSDEEGDEKEDDDEDDKSEEDSESEKEDGGEGQEGEGGEEGEGEEGKEPRPRKKARIACDGDEDESDDAADKSRDDGDDSFIDDLPIKRRIKEKKKNRKGRPKKAYKCDKCARIFYQAKGFNRHLRTHEDSERPPRPPREAKTKAAKKPRVFLPRILDCLVCKKMFKRSSHLNRHMLIHTGEKPYICEICGDRFARPDKLRAHKKLHDANRQYLCATCGEAFSLPKLLRIHRKTHKTERVFSCEDCGKVFTVYARLYRHRVIHSGIKPYLCEICGDRFTQSTDLQRHRIIHTGVKSHLCDTCGKKFYHSAHLRRHVKVHARLKPYICETCGGQFARSDILKRHERIHTGEKHYKCDTCGKLFTRASHLGRHMVIHNGQKQVQQCSFCDETFKSPERLKHHVKMRHSTLPIPDQDSMNPSPTMTNPSTTPAPEHSQLPSSRPQFSTPDPNRAQLQSPGARSYCSDVPDQNPRGQDLNRTSASVNPMHYTKPFMPQNPHSSGTGEQLSHFNHHLGLQPHQGFFPHQNNTKFDCVMCGEQFPSANLLEMHYSMHTAEKHGSSFDSNFGPNFSRHLDLPSNVPQRHHHGDENYRCEICGERFLDLNHFQLHCIMHTNDSYETYGRQFAQFPYANPSMPFALPNDPKSVLAAKQKFSDQFRPLFGSMPQPQNLSLSSPHHSQTPSNQQNPSCQKVRTSQPQSFREQLADTSPAQSPVGFNPYSNDRSCSVPQMNYQNQQSMSQNSSHGMDNSGPIGALAAMKASQALNFQPQFPESYPRHSNHQQPPYHQQHSMPTSSTPPPMNFATGSEVPKKSISIMKNLPKPRKRTPKPPSAQAMPNMELPMGPAIGHLLDGVPVLNPEVNIGGRPSAEDKKQFKCGTCGEKFDTPELRIEHVKIHIAELDKKHECKVCHKKFVLFGDMRAHLKSEHPGAVSTPKTPKPKPKPAVQQTPPSPRLPTQTELDEIMEALNSTSGGLDPKQEADNDKPHEPGSDPIMDPLNYPNLEALAADDSIFLKCSECNATFTSESALRRHARFHNPSPVKRERPDDTPGATEIKTELDDDSTPRFPSREVIKIGNDFVCEICLKSFKRSQHLQRHKILHSGLKPYKCHLCEDAFVRSDKLHTHLVKIHGETPPRARKKLPIECKECDMTFEKKAELREHDKALHPNKPQPYECVTCHKKFKRQFHLKRHRRVHVKGKRRKSNTTEYCEYCNAEFKTEYDLTRHRREIHGDETTYQCIECDAKFVSDVDLALHKTLNHSGGDTSTDAAPAGQEEGELTEQELAELTAALKVPCTMCDKKFTTPTLLEKHVKRRHRILPNEKCNCEVCGKEFNARAHLRRHMKVHSGEKPYMCETCGDKFSRSSHLQRHKIRHTGEKSFKCATCGMAFSRSDHLLCHERTHSGSKPFVCDMCGLQFSSSQGLKGHMTTHTGEKPYVCRECGEKFARNSHLVRHRAAVHNNGNIFPCEICGKTFTRRDQLKRHVKIHSAEKSHVCQICGKGFARNSQLTKHEKTHREPSREIRDLQPPPPPPPPRIPLSMMDWPKWSDYPSQFPLTGSILQAAMAPMNMNMNMNSPHAV